jgi:hypothetical protein
MAALLPARTPGAMGDERTYDHLRALRAATSTDGMTADSDPFEHALFEPGGDAGQQRGAGDQPGGLRREEQAAGDDRMGVRGAS